MPCLNAAKCGALVFLMGLFLSSTVAESLAKQPTESKPKKPLVITPTASTPTESLPTETSVVYPNGFAVSGSGRATPVRVRPVNPSAVKKVKVSDIAKPGTPAYAIREFEEKTQKEFFQNRQGILSELKDVEFAQAFDKRVSLLCLRYPIWPIAMNINPPLQSNNIFVLDANNKIIALIGDTDNLRKFCSQNMLPVKTEQQARTALVAYLRLQQELAQDGMFQFSIKKESLKFSRTGDQILIAGRSIVAPNSGNEGYLESQLVFAANGKLKSAESTNKLQEGMRPICQSTKLLDPDPIVRKMAEQDILLMGPACKFYLDDMHSRANPETRKAIENIWKRIERREAERKSRGADLQ